MLDAPVACLVTLRGGPGDREGAAPAKPHMASLVDRYRTPRAVQASSAQNATRLRFQEQIPNALTRVIGACGAFRLTAWAKQEWREEVAQVDWLDRHFLRRPARACRDASLR